MMEIQSKQMVWFLYDKQLRLTSEFLIFLERDFFPEMD